MGGMSSTDEMNIKRVFVIYVPFVIATSEDTEAQDVRQLPSCGCLLLIHEVSHRFRTGC